MTARANKGRVEGGGEGTITNELKQIAKGINVLKEVTKKHTSCIYLRQKIIGLPAIILWVY